MLEEGLDTSTLPETLREDFEQLGRLEGKYRVTSGLIEFVGVEVLSPRKGSLCRFCNVKEWEAKMMNIVEHLKPMTTLSKVIQNDLTQFFNFNMETRLFPFRLIL